MGSLSLVSVVEFVRAFVRVYCVVAVVRYKIDREILFSFTICYCLSKDRH